MASALVCASCGSSDAQAMAVDAGECQGGNCAVGDQRCPDGQVVNGVEADGRIVCVDQVRLRQQQCSGRLVVAGIRADGSVMCVDPVTVASCGPGEVMTGIGDSGDPVCTTIEGLVREYVNTRCYLYFGWRDSCDGCTEPPTKAGRVRGDAMDCTAAGADGNCANFTLFGQDVPMVSVNTDGDVDGNDTFWVGMKCE